MRYGMLVYRDATTGLENSVEAGIVDRIAIPDFSDSNVPHKANAVITTPNLVIYCREHAAVLRESYDSKVRPNG